MKRFFLLLTAVCFLTVLALANSQAQDVKALVQKGIEDCNNGKFDQAIAKFNQALKIKPNDASLYVYRGRAKYAKNLNMEAIADFNKALKIDPNFAQAYNTRAQVHYTLEKFDQALADLQKAKSLGFKIDADYLKLVQKRVRQKRK